MKGINIIFFLSIIAFAVFATPIIAVKQIQIGTDIILSNDLKADKVCLGAVCKTSW